MTSFPHNLVLDSQPRFGLTQLEFKTSIRPYFFQYLVYGFFFKILRSEEGKK